MSDIESARLIFRNWREGDAPALYEMGLDPEWQKSGAPAFRSMEECEHAVRLFARQGDMKALIRKADRRLIGLIGLGDMNRYEGYQELEYAIAPTHRNQGYATEAVLRMLEFGFGERNLSVIAAWVRSHNAPSVRVLEKCGLSFEGRLRRHARDRGDTLCYSMLREEWAERREPAR